MEPEPLDPDRLADVLAFLHDHFPAAAEVVLHDLQAQVAAGEGAERDPEVGPVAGEASGAGEASEAAGSSGRAKSEDPSASR